MELLDRNRTVIPLQVTITMLDIPSLAFKPAQAHSQFKAILCCHSGFYTLGHTEPCICSLMLILLSQEDIQAHTSLLDKYLHIKLIHSPELANCDNPLS